jgi:hypothetical protein
MTQYTTPISWPRGLFVSSSIMNAQVRDNITHLKEQLQALGRVAVSNFDGMLLSTHPSEDLALSKIYLARAQWIVVLDDAGGNAAAVEITSPLVADIASPGAGGLDTGTEEASTWYDIMLVRKSGDGTTALMLHKHSNVVVQDEVQATGGAGTSFRYSPTGVEKVAQGFSIDETDVPISHVHVYLWKAGTPTGYVWMTIESDNAGSPSGTAIATSPKFDVANLGTVAGHAVFFFDTSTANLLTGVQYHFVLHSDVAMGSSNYISVVNVGSSTYPRGQLKTYNGTVWTGVTADVTFGLWVRRALVAPTMPVGYDQKALIGYAYNNASSNLTKFMATNRVIVPHESQLMIANVGTAPTFVAISGLVPPVPVSLRPVIDAPASSVVRVGGLRRLPGVSNVPRANGQVIVSNGAGAASITEGGIVSTAVAAVYASSSVAGSNIYLNSWEWF